MFTRIATAVKQAKGVMKKRFPDKSLSHKTDSVLIEYIVVV